MAETKDINAEHAQTAARMNPDVGMERIADIYAEGLLAAGEKAGKTQALLEEFDSFVKDVLDSSPRFETILNSVLVSVEEREGILDRVLGGKASPLFLIFLKVVSRHGRMDCLRAIRRQAVRLYDALQNRIPIQLATAEPIGPELAAKIRLALRTKLGGEPIVETVVDPSILGGAVLRLGDTVYDASIAHQLNILRQQMVDRSAHEIQSRRDSFRNSK